MYIVGGCLIYTTAAGVLRPDTICRIYVDNIDFEIEGSSTFAKPSIRQYAHAGQHIRFL